MANRLSENRKIKTDELIIDGHLLKWKNVTVQISNISSITTWEIKPRFPILSIILGIVGIVLLILVEYDRSFRYMDLDAYGTAALVFAFIRFIIWLIAYLMSKNLQYLHIYMASGAVYSILFKNKEFAQEVLQLFARIFKDGGNVGDNYYINVAGGKIDNIGHKEYQYNR